MKKIFKYHKNIIRSFRKTAHITLPLALFMLGAGILYSAPPVTKYEAGETLDPTCGPGDLNCSVEIGSSHWEVDGLDIYYNAGNVGLGDSAYLNWNTTFGSGGYGLRDNAGEMEFKDLGGNWTAFNTLGGGGGSLWTLHGNGEDVYYNDGFVGVNTAEPEYQFESTSNTIAARFRGVAGDPPTPWDLTTYTQDGFYEVIPEAPDNTCRAHGSTFNPTGTKMFLSGDCYFALIFSVHEYDLSTPWDVNTAVDTGNSYDPVLEGDASHPPLGTFFTPDGQTMFVINSVNNNYPTGGEIHEYSLVTPWSLASGNVTYVQSRVFPSPLELISSFQFSDDGSSLFVGGYYYDTEEADLLQYELTVPWDISTLVEYSTLKIAAFYQSDWFYQNGAMSFDNTGDNLFVSLYDDEVVVIRKYALSTSWDIDSLDEAVYVEYPAPALLANYDQNSITFRPNGLRFYVTQYDDPPGLAQFSLTSDSVGGNVVVDGTLAVGNTNPSHKLHVTSSSSGIVAMFEDSNASCWVDPSGWGFDCSSDERLKSEILSINSNTEIESSLSRLTKLDPVSYRWLKEEGTNAPVRYGFIAQEVQEVFPELVSEGPLLDSNNPTAGRSLGVSYVGFTPFMIDAISELNDKVDFISSFSLDSSELGVETGSSLPEIILRVLRDAVLHVRELVANTIHTSKLCIDDVCFTAEEAQKVKDLLGEDSQDEEVEGIEVNPEAEEDSPEETESPDDLELEPEDNDTESLEEEETVIPDENNEL